MTNLIKVFCPTCRTYSEIMAPAADHDGPIVWLCQHPKDDGEPCGSTNTRED